jgi:peptidoglycan-associated lipoprotein
MNRTHPRLLLAALAAAFAWGCASTHPAARPAEQQASASAPTAASEPTTAAPADEQPSLRGQILQKAPGVEAIYFAYDSSDLTEAARQTLTKNADWLKEHPETKVQTAGHCDQRGTESYNLALGQRRAAQVRAYYLSLGIPADHVASTSFGKDRPACSASTEACWAKNRRAETLISYGEDVSSRRRR